MAKKRIDPANYIEIELSLAEEQLAVYKRWLEDNPYDSFKDRVEWKQMANGGAQPVPVATKESQQKNHRETLKDYLSLSSVVKNLREQEDKKEQMRKGYETNNILDD